jgi:hypothetical protein
MTLPIAPEWSEPRFFFSFSEDLSEAEKALGNSFKENPRKTYLSLINEPYFVTQIENLVRAKRLFFIEMKRAEHKPSRLQLRINWSYKSYEGKNFEPCLDRQKFIEIFIRPYDYSGVEGQVLYIKNRQFS